MKPLYKIILSVVLAVSCSQQHVMTVGGLHEPISEADSHAGACEWSSMEMDYRTRVSLSKQELGWKDLNYPRIKKLQDGTFVLFFQPAKISASIYASFSQDAVTWTEGVPVFEPRKTLNSGGDSDEIRYSSADALVLSNGDILLFAPFRVNKGYKMFQQDDGIAMKRSADGGHTWSVETVIYSGANWEPFALEMPDGEIQVYFTDSTPDILGSSAGVSLLRSNDAGKTWSLQEYISRQFKCVSTRVVDGRQISLNAYSDQMPSVCILGNGDKLMAMETVHYEGRSLEGTKQYMLSFAWTDSDWPRTLAYDETGPEWKEEEAFAGCAPYLVHFRSGETVLSYNTKYYYIRVGNERGDNFKDVPAYEPFPGALGYWGSMEKVDERSIIATVPEALDQEKRVYNLAVARLYLNHKINVGRMTPSMDGREKDWDGVTEALFVGSESEAQCLFRFAQNPDKLFILADYLDSDIEDGDRLDFSFGDEGPLFSLEVGQGQPEIVGAPGVKGKVSLVAGEGYVAEIAVPKSMLDVESLFFNPSIVKKDGEMVDKMFRSVPLEL